MGAKLTPEACRAARGILRWSVRDLAREAGVSPTTINLLESGRAYRADTAEAVSLAFLRMGVEITNGTGTGARLLTGSARLKLNRNIRDRILAQLEKAERKPPSATRETVIARCLADLAKFDEEVRTIVAAEHADGALQAPEPGTIVRCRGSNPKDA